MTTIKYVGKPSLHFYGKYLSEIAKNLRNRGVGRVVVKESETRQFKEPCYYVLKDVEPLMSDLTGVRCRATAERVFRGHNFGVVQVPKTHEPDWKLLSVEEGRKLQAEAAKGLSRAPDVPIKCVAPMPPLLAIKLRMLGKIPQSICEAASKAVPEGTSPAASQWVGHLLLSKLFENPTSFQVPIEPTAEEKARIFPDYDTQVRDGGGLVRKARQSVSPNVYYIRRSDTPGLKWRVELADKNVEDELLQPPEEEETKQEETASACK